jgi:hypothetical protein
MAVGNLRPVHTRMITVRLILKETNSSLNKLKLISEEDILPKIPKIIYVIKRWKGHQSDKV